MTTNITAQRIVSLRESRGLLQPDLAQLAQIEQSYVSKLERGKAPNVSGIVLARIATALETSVDFLLGISDDPAPRPLVNSPALRDPQFRPFLETWRLLSELADLGDEAGRKAKAALRLQAEVYGNLARERLKRKKADE